MKKIKEFIKTYWIPILLLIACIFFMGRWGSGYFKYRHELKITNDVIKTIQEEKAEVKRTLQQLTREYDILNDILNVREELLIAEKQKRKNDSIRYETEIINVRAWNRDFKYCFLTRGLDSLQTVWKTP